MGKTTLTILSLSGVVFPYQPIKIVLPQTSPLFNKPLTGTFIGLCFQKDPLQEKATSVNALNDYGVAIKITHEIMESGWSGHAHESGKMIGGSTLRRFKVKKFTSTSPPFAAEVELLTDELTIEKENGLNQDGTVKKLKELGLKFAEAISGNDHRAKYRAEYIKSESDLIRLHYTIASYLNISNNDKYKLLEIGDVEERIRALVKTLEEQIRLDVISKDISAKANQNMRQDVRKQLLRKHLQEINKELYGSEKDEIAQLEEKINNCGLPSESLEKVNQEFARFRQMNPRDPDYNIQRKYLETVADLPWSKTSQEITEILHAQQILDRDHAGLEKIKKRVLEFLAVKILNKSNKGSILCFQGPPGVGKTSLGKSIADALGRKFERISLGGVRDEAEIRGHRRTYIGALPGILIEALLRCKTKNPVILLDEIDKVGKENHHGDVSAALLEVLDPNQNHTFRDHYLGLPFDLSNVLFIATANSLDPIPPALLDRLETINLVGYTKQEKLEIAKNYLIPKQLTENGLDQNIFQIPDQPLDFLIKYYTAEAGVRNLERAVGSLCRKTAFELLKHNQVIEKTSENPNAKQPFSPIIVTEAFIEDVLGPRKHDDDITAFIDQPGIAIGLAWTQVGGKCLLVEASKAPGKGNIQITGQLGDVMKESVMTALGWIKSHHELLSLLSMTPENRNKALLGDVKGDYNLDKLDLHIHFPAAAIPKDGPSAGITIAITLISLLTGIKVRPDIAMTGEISLKGAVLPVGGIKEKALAAYDRGIKQVILPAKNQKDIEEISSEIRKNIKFYFVKQITDVIRLALDMTFTVIDAENVLRLGTNISPKL
jgi:ATP-dependent Lon protease